MGKLFHEKSDLSIQKIGVSDQFSVSVGENARSIGQRAWGTE